MGGAPVTPVLLLLLLLLCRLVKPRKLTAKQQQLLKEFAAEDK
jgi:putative effector of murein hydrolase LrgA (UPF0299 family)